MELKEGMYVRTPLGITKYLGKHKMFDGSIAENLHEFDKLDEELWSGDLYGVVFDCDLEDIVLKSSPNIMDLIEKNDYINGLKVIQMYSPEGKYTIWIKLSDNTFIDNSEDIKSIVTHEQFQSMQYNLESEVN